MSLPFVTADLISEILSYDKLIPAIKQAFAMTCHSPERGHYQMGGDWKRDAQMLIMPAWRSDHYFGVKILSLYPDNPAKGVPNITGIYSLFDGQTGRPLIQMDAGEITLRRTAATSVLAAKYLAPKALKNYLIVGTGALAEPFIEAYGSQFAFDHIMLYGRSKKNASKIIERLSNRFPNLKLAEDLEQAVAEADIISTITTAKHPVLSGHWLSAGTHLDLVGSYRPDMREVDDLAIQKSSLFVDIMDGAPTESGDLIIPMESGLITMSDIKADLKALVEEKHPARTSEDEITLFKSAGAALEDLAAAVLVYESLK